MIDSEMPEKVNHPTFTCEALSGVPRGDTTPIRLRAYARRILGGAVNRFISDTVILILLAAVSFFVYPHLDDLGFGAYEGEASGPLVPLAAESEAVLPAQLLIPVPFSSQAPLGSWAQPWQDACEETSVLMAVAWARGFELNPRLAAEEILRQVEFEERVIGYHRDTNIKDTARLLKDFYRYENFEIRSQNVTAVSIKEELAAGNLVIVPLAGKMLMRENPYFSSPLHYHMVVIRGFDELRGGFIVNEPGTKRGEAFFYSYSTLMDAIHDWTGSAETVEGGAENHVGGAPGKKIAVSFYGAMV